MSYCGLDFGTSNSTIGIHQNTAIKMVALDGDKTTLRSAIFINDEDKTLEFGDGAIRHYINGTEGRLLMSLKSVLGSALMDKNTLIFNKMESFTTILGYFIQHIKRKAETNAQQSLTNIVMGRPVYFNDHEPEVDQLAQNTLEKILKTVGFKEVQFQFEPIAASAFYRQQITEEELALIVDLGGGTSDFSLVRMHPKHPATFNDILATEGIHIGGNDFDYLLNFQKVSPYLGRGSRIKNLNGSELEMPVNDYYELATWHKINFLYSKESIINLQRLLPDAYEKDKLQRLLTVLQNRYGHQIAEQVELSKIRLSHQANTAIDLGFLEQDLQIPVNTQELDQYLAHSIQQLRQVIKTMLIQASVPANQISSVFFTGGSSKISLIRQSIMQLFPTAKLIEGDSFHSVGMGLAIEAQARFGR